MLTLTVSYMKNDVFSVSKYTIQGNGMQIPQNVPESHLLNALQKEDFERIWYEVDKTH